MERIVDMRLVTNAGRQGAPNIFLLEVLEQKGADTLEHVTVGTMIGCSHANMLYDAGFDLIIQPPKGTLEIHREEMDQPSWDGIVANAEKGIATLVRGKK